MSVLPLVSILPWKRFAGRQEAVRCARVKFWNRPRILAMMKRWVYRHDSPYAKQTTNYFLFVLMTKKGYKREMMLSISVKCRKTNVSQLLITKSTSASLAHRFRVHKAYVPRINTEVYSCDIHIYQSTRKGPQCLPKTNKKGQFSRRITIMEPCISRSKIVVTCKF